eukprot:5617558-Amphidinium_carterae.2
MHRNASRFGSGTSCWSFSSPLIVQCSRKKTQSVPTNGKHAFMSTSTSHSLSSPEVELSRPLETDRSSLRRSICALSTSANELKPQSFVVGLTCVHCWILRSSGIQCEHARLPSSSQNRGSLCFKKRHGITSSNHIDIKVQQIGMFLHKRVVVRSACAIPPSLLQQQALPAVQTADKLGNPRIGDWFTHQ